jgi:hypothetical protein
MFQKYLFSVVFTVCVADAHMPCFYSEIYLNDGEHTDYSIIESFGMEGVNYFKTFISGIPKEADTVILAKREGKSLYSYLYQSARSGTLIVKLEYYIPHNQIIPRITFYGDTSDNENLKSWLKSELAWLAGTGIITFAKDDSIAAFLAPYFSYWTHQNRFLLNNTKFVYDMTLNLWTDNIIVAKGIGINPTPKEIDVPPEPLIIASVKKPAGHFLEKELMSNSVHPYRIFNLTGCCIVNRMNFATNSIPVSGAFLKPGKKGQYNCVINVKDR